MSPRRLLIAAIVLAALAGGVWWSNRHKAAEAAKPAADSTSPKVMTVPEDQVAQIELVRKDAQPTIVKKNGAGKWDITAPKAVPADKDSVQSLVGTLTSLSADQVVEDKPGDLSAYGLATPSFQLAVTKKDGKTQRLLLGEEAPTSGLVYAKTDSDPKVYAISTSLKSSLDKTWQDLRDKRLLTFDQDKLTRVELTAKKQTVELGRNAQNEWQILKPSPARADGWQVEELIRKLKDAKMDTSASDEDAKKAASGFASGTPVGVARVTDAAGTQTLEVRKSKDDYYAKSSVVDGVYKVANDLGTGLDKSPEDFRNKKLFDFGFSDPTKFEVREPGKNALVYTKSGEKWWLNGKEMDSGTVQQFIDKARDLAGGEVPGQSFRRASFRHYRDIERRQKDRARPDLERRGLLRKTR